MPADTLSPLSEAATIQRAIRAFPALLEKNAALLDPISPVAHPMNQGVDGHSGVITATNGETLFLKAVGIDQAQWVGFKSAETMAQNSAGAGLAPRLIASNEAAGAFLFEALDQSWRPAIVRDLRDVNVRSSIIGAVEKLHRLAPVGHQRSVFARISEMHGHMETGTRHVKTGAFVKVTPPENFEHMCVAVEMAGRGLQAAGADTAPCHVENSLSNYLLGPSVSVKIVDFDRAADCDPLSDIGALCNEYCRTESDIIEAVEIYSGRTDATLTARVKLHMILSAFYWGMWGKISHFSSYRPEIEYYKYGENQFLRCAYHLANWDVNQLIRAL